MVIKLSLSRTTVTTLHCLDLHNILRGERRTDVESAQTAAPTGDLFRSSSIHLSTICTGKRRNGKKVENKKNVGDYCTISLSKWEKVGSKFIFISWSSVRCT